MHGWLAWAPFFNFRFGHPPSITSPYLINYGAININKLQGPSATGKPRQQKSMRCWETRCHRTLIRWFYFSGCRNPPTDARTWFRNPPAFPNLVHDDLIQKFGLLRRGAGTMGTMGLHFSYYWTKSGLCPVWQSLVESLSKSSWDHGHQNHVLVKNVPLDLLLIQTLTLG